MWGKPMELEQHRKLLMSRKEKEVKEIFVHTLWGNYKL